MIYTEPSNASAEDFQKTLSFPKIKLITKDTLQINNETHTLMNLLQNVIVNKNNKFCGYVIPHPSVPNVHFKVINDDIFETIDEGLKDIEEMCLVSADKLIPYKK